MFDSCHIVLFGVNYIDTYHVWKNEFCNIDSMESCDISLNLNFYFFNEFTNPINLTEDGPDASDGVEPSLHEP